MLTRLSSVENVGHFPSVFDQNSDNVFTPNYCFHAACGLDASNQDSSERSIMTYDVILDLPSLATGLEMASLPSDSPFLESFHLVDPLKSAEGYSDSFFLSDAPSNKFNWDHSIIYSSSQSGIEMIRTPSVAPSESASSDIESNPWSTNSRQCGPKNSNTGSAIHKCPMCKKSFSRVLELERHAKEAKHKPFACGDCKACFSRQDALTRHREIHDSQKLYPCPRCDKYQESAAFRRRDHLRQHLWKKHRVHPNTEFPRHCPFECCTCSEQLKHLAKFDGFGSRREYSKHMREVHGKETHDCDIKGCDRVGNKGFARITDLQRHRKMVHGRL